MAKFSEIPFYVIKDYFTRKDIDGNYNLPVYGQTPPSGSWTLHGQNTGITALGGSGIELYIKTSNDYYRLKGVYKTSNEDTDISRLYSREELDESFVNIGKNNSFVFELIPSGSSYRPSEFTRAELFPEDDDRNYADSGIYFKRGTPIYDYIISEGYDDFINVNKSFLYFGKIWPGNTDTSIDIYSEHFKDYVYRCLPTHNRSDNYDEFLGVAFDKIYAPTYNLLKNISSLIDPYEIPEKYLMYLRETFNAPKLFGGFDERAFLHRIISFLKRKGTYTQLYSVWKIICNTSNRLNIYERWHIPLSAGTVPYSYFEDHLYTKNRLYQSATPSGGAGYRYYRTIYPCSVFDGTYYGIDVPYPVYGDTDYDYDVDSVYANLFAATMEFKFDMDDEWIITHNANTPFVMTQMWVSAGEAAIAGNSLPTGMQTYALVLDEPASGSAMVVIPDFTHSQVIEATTWTVNHTLSEKFPLVIVTDRKHNRIMPKEIIAIDEDTTEIDFGTYKVNGYVMFKKPDYTHIQHTKDTVWNVTHGLDTAVIAMVYDSSYPAEKMVMPQKIEFTDDNATVTFPVSCTGRAIFADVLDRPKKWTLNHNLGTISGAMVQTWDDNLYNFWPGDIIAPNNISASSIVNETTSASSINFSDYQPGYAMAVSADYIHDQSTPASAWTIVHNLGDMYPVVDVLNSEFSHISPKAYAVHAVDTDNTTITFPTTATGYALIGLPDYTCVQTVPSASWFLHHQLYTDFNLVTVYDGDTDVSIPPEDIRHYKWTNNIALNFGAPLYGYVSLKHAYSAEQYLQRVHNLNKTLSTHIKIEIDLTTEPLEIDSIITKEKLDKLTMLWEHCRPISRVYHYGMVIGPTVDFTGNRSVLYPTSNVKFISKCTIGTVTPIANSYVQMVPNGANIVNIFHRLNTEDVVVQCYDSNNYLVEPDEAYPTSANVFKVVFDEWFTGYITISKADTVETISSYAVSGSYYVWDVNTIPVTAGFDHIPQVSDENKYKIIPDGIVKVIP